MWYTAKQNIYNMYTYVQFKIVVFGLWIQVIPEFLYVL